MFLSHSVYTVKGLWHEMKTFFHAEHEGRQIKFQNDLAKTWMARSSLEDSSSTADLRWVHIRLLGPIEVPRSPYEANALKWRIFVFTLSDLMYSWYFSFKPLSATIEPGSRYWGFEVLHICYELNGWSFLQNRECGFGCKMSCYQPLILIAAG